MAAGCELSVTVSVQESRKRASGVPANIRVAGAKPIPEGSAPPAQVKEYVYGSTPPEAAGSASLWKVPTERLTLLRSGGSVSGGVTPVTSTSTAIEAVAAGCELSVTVSVQESRKRASGVPANIRVAGAKPIPEGSAPPAQVKEYVYGSTPPEASGSASLWKVPTERLTLLRSGGSVSGRVVPVTSTSTAIEAVAASCELSVAVSVQESWKRAAGVPANIRVAGAKPIPEGSAPPAQVKEYVYGSTPPEAAGSASLWKVPTERLTLPRGGGSVSGGVAPVTTTSTAIEVVAAGCELSVTVSVQESRKRAAGVPANIRVAGAKPIPEGSAPPAQVKEYVYGSTPPEASGSALLWKVPTERLTLLRSGRERLTRAQKNQP